MPDDDPLSLTEMMSLEPGGREPWATDELRAVLEHQLSAPLLCDLDDATGELSELLEAVGAAGERPIRTFGDLLQHPHPPLGLLQRTKQFAKACRNRPDSALPDEIATVLYFMSIVAAMIKCGRRITRMDDASLRYSLDWAVRQTWLDEATHKLFKEGVAAIAAVPD